MRPAVIVLPVIFACCVLANSLSPVRAEASKGLFEEIVDVELVVVDVIAETSDGRPVTDLERGDFRLFEDGRPVEVSQFTPGATGRKRSGGGGDGGMSGGDVAQGRRIVVFIDDLHLHVNSRRQVLGRLARVLDEHLAARDEVMVVAYGGVAEVVLPMTGNRGAIKNALKRQADSATVSLLADSDEDRVLRVIHQVRQQYSRNGSAANDKACRDVGHVAHTHAQQVQQRVLATISELERFVSALGGYDGPKMVLHVSDGVPLVAGAEGYLYAAELCDGSGVSKGIPDSMDTVSTSGLRYNYWDPTSVWSTLQEFDTTDQWTRLAGHANTYRVSFYTFLASQQTNRAGGVDGPRTSMDVERQGEKNKEGALFVLADETGGVAFLHGGDVESVLARMDEDAQARYQLAYAPPTPGDGKRHAIRVEVDRPGVSVRSRKSYRSKTQDERIADHVLSVLMHGRQENPLGVRVEVAPDPPERRGPTSVEIRVQVPMEGLVLLPDDDARRGLFTVYLALRGERGQVTPVGRKTLPVSLAASGEGEESYLYTVEVPIWGDGGEVGVAVRDRIGGETSYLRRSVKVRGAS